ncbi:MAG: hypothetical protein LBU45_09575 [Azoarcus sp.]|nr:hypothetical protein [Azoarcus sp.]
MPCLVLSMPRLQPSGLAEYAEAITWQARRRAGIDPTKEASANEKISPWLHDLNGDMMLDHRLRGQK